jgi:fructokinase
VLPLRKRVAGKRVGRPRSVCAMTAAAAIAVIGEALIDLVELGDDDPRLARPGGSPYNVALGLARLGQRTAFVGRISRDPLGVVLRNHALRSGVDLSPSVAADEPSTVAMVELDAAGRAQYRFGVRGTADFQWTAAELARVPGDYAAVHFGSLASWLAPGDTAIAQRVGELRAAGSLVTYDPNVRPLLQPDRAAAREQIERTLPLAHLVKTSDDDIDWLRPGEAAADVAADWLTLGPTAVIVTGGATGALAVTGDGVVFRPPVAVEVVDTVGAGDAFMTGMLDGLARRGLLAADALASAPFADVLDDAALVAAVTCAHAGANPPRRDELSSFRG